MQEKRMSIHERLTLIYIIVMLTVHLFFVGQDGYLSIASEKFSAFCWISGSYIILCVILFIERIIIGVRHLPSFHKIQQYFSLPSVLVLIYLGFTWLSAIMSEYWPDTVIGATRFEGALTISLYCVCFLLVSVYGCIHRKLVFLVGVSLSVFSVICIIQMQGVNLFALFPEGYTYLDSNVRFYGAYIGTVGNVDVVASLYSLAVPFLMYCMISQKGKPRFFLLIPLLLSLYVVLRIQVKAGYVGIAAGCILAIPLLIGKNRLHRMRLTIFIAILILIFLVALFFFDPGSGMFHELHEILRGNLNPDFGTGRIHIWTEVLQRVPDHLWLGTGPDTMAYGGLEGFIDYDARLGEWIAAGIDAAHNEYLNILYHQGIFALIAYVSFLLSVIGKAWMADKPAKGETAALSAGIIGYLAQAFFGISVCVTAPYLWLALALVIKGVPKKQERSADKINKEREPDKMNKKRGQDK